MFGNKKPLEIIREIRTLNFDQDIKALLFLIDHKLRFYVEYKLKVKANISRYQLSDTHIKPLIGEIATDIIESIAKDYKSILLYYFTEEALTMFITEKVLMELNSSYKDYWVKNNKVVSLDTSLDEEEKK